MTGILFIALVGYVIYNMISTSRLNKDIIDRYEKLNTAMRKQEEVDIAADYYSPYVKEEPKKKIAQPTPRKSVLGVNISTAKPKVSNLSQEENDRLVQLGVGVENIARQIGEQPEVLLRKLTEFIDNRQMPSAETLMLQDEYING